MKSGLAVALTAVVAGATATGVLLTVDSGSTPASTTHGTGKPSAASPTAATAATTATMSVPSSNQTQPTTFAGGFQIEVGTGATARIFVQSGGHGVATNAPVHLSATGGISIDVSDGVTDAFGYVLVDFVGQSPGEGSINAVAYGPDYDWCSGCFTGGITGTVWSLAAINVGNTYNPGATVAATTVTSPPLLNASSATGNGGWIDESYVTWSLQRNGVGIPLPQGTTTYIITSGFYIQWLSEIVFPALDAGTYTLTASTPYGQTVTSHTFTVLGGVTFELVDEESTVVTDDPTSQRASGINESSIVVTFNGHAIPSSRWTVTRQWGPGGQAASLGPSLVRIAFLPDPSELVPGSNLLQVTAHDVAGNSLADDNTSLIYSFGQ